MRAALDADGQPALLDKKLNSFPPGECILKGPENPRDPSPPDSPFFGFSNADIPQPILIKTEPMEVPEGGVSGVLEEGGDVDDDECVVVKVTRAAKPLPQQFIKMEKEEKQMTQEASSGSGMARDKRPMEEHEQDEGKRAKTEETDMETRGGKRTVFQGHFHLWIHRRNKLP